jgi:AcrR family transcriptional regulator
MEAAEEIPNSRRLPHGAARDRILDAAERLFAEAGLDGVSFRDLAGAAGVSLSAIHYHFGSKHAVLSEIFERRAGALTSRREELLTALPRDGEGRKPLEGILTAFLQPALEVTRGDRDDLFNRLLARLAAESSEVTREIVKTAFDSNDLAFIAELKRALPHLTDEDIHWRFHFMVGAMIYTMSDSGQLVGLSGGTCNASDTRVALSNLVAGFAGMFRTAKVC